MADIVTTLRERPYRLASESNTEMQGRRQAEREYAAHEIEVLRLEKAKLAADNERLRAALREILGWHDYSNDMHKPIEVRAAYMRARAALEGK